MARTPRTKVIPDAAAQPLDLTPDMVADEVAPDMTPDAAPIEDAVLIEDSIPDTAPEPAPLRAPLPEPPAAPAPSRPIEPVTRRPSLVPMVLGGCIAAAIGFAAAWYSRDLTGGDPTAALATQEARLAALESTPGPDLTPLQGGLASLESNVSELSAAQSTGAEALAVVQADLAALSDRLTTLERAPAADGSLSAAAITSWQAEIDSLRAELAAESARVTDLADALAATPPEPAVDTAAIAAAQLAARRAAMDRILAALDAGTPFDAPLADLAANGATIDPALAASASAGVVTMAALTDSFPDAARAALSIARAEGLAEESSGLTGFLRNQFSVRSVTPREGSDPDAILSRAEAALRDGRLSDAMAEVASLPEVVRAEMADWTSGAEARLAAQAAALALSETLTMN
jgi:hypothetical protein